MRIGILDQHHEERSATCKSKYLGPHTIALLLCGLFSAAPCFGQTGVGGDQNKPLLGPHDYIGHLAETVTPANGQLSVRIPVLMPKGRGVNLPLYIAYDTNGVYNNRIGAQNQYFFNSSGGGPSIYYDLFVDDDIVYSTSSPIYGLASQNGWSYTYPSYTQTQHTLTAAAPIETEGQPENVNEPVQCNWVNDVLFSDSSGNSHLLNLTWVSNQNTCAQATGAGYTSNGYAVPGTEPPQTMNAGADEQVQAIWTPNSTYGPSVPGLPYLNSPITVAEHDGTVYNFGSSQQAGPSSNLPLTTGQIATAIEDRNGNLFTIQSNYPGDKTGRVVASDGVKYIDSTGRAVLSTSGFATPTDTFAVSGLLQPYKVNWAPIQTSGTTARINSEVLNPSSATQCPAVALPASPTSSTSLLPYVTSLVLPNGDTYTFHYNPAYGLIDQITYPTGAWVKYTWGVNPLSTVFRTLPSNIYSVPTATNCYVATDTFAITERDESADGVNVALKQMFSYSTQWTNGGSWSSKTTTVTDDDLVRNTTKTTTYTYTGVPGPADTTDERMGSTVQPTQLPLEQTINYSGLEVVTKQWESPTRLACEIDTYGSSSKGVFNQYDSVDNSPVETRTYDFGSVSPTDCNSFTGYAGGSWPAASALTDTVTQYVAFGAVPTFPSNALLVGYPRALYEFPKTVSITGAGGNSSSTTYTYDEPSRIVETPSTATEHDDVNYAFSAIVPRGNVTSISRQLGSGAIITHTTYDDTGNGVAMQDGNGNSTTISYNDSFTGGGPAAYSTYLAPTLITDAKGFTEQYVYDYSSGLPVQYTDANVQTTSYIYSDAARRLTDIYSPAQGNGPRPHTVYSYSDGSTPSVTTTDPDGVQNEILLDGLWRKRKSVLLSDPSGPIYTFSLYDGEGKLYEQWNPTRCDPSSSSSCPSEKTFGFSTFTYDNLGREISRLYPDGSQTSSIYSANIHTSIDEAANLWMGTTDGLGRLTRVVEPTGIPTTYSYDALGNLATVTQTGVTGEIPRVHSFSYDSLSRLLSAQNPETGLVAYQYDPNGNLLSKADARGQTVKYTYDALNRILTKARLGGSSDQYFYDGQLGTSGITQDLGNNLVGRLSFTRSFNPDLAGSSCNSSTKHCDDQYLGYDVLGRMNYLGEASPSEWGLGVHTTSAQFDLAGKLAETVYPDGSTITNTYDSSGRLRTVFAGTASTPGQLYVSNTSYFPDGRPATVTYGNGVTEVLAENIRLQPCEISAFLPSAIGGTMMLDRQLLYSQSTTTPCVSRAGNNGNILQIVDNTNAVQGSTARNQVFTYDSLNRLHSWNTPSMSGLQRSQTYLYDSFGNAQQTGGVNMSNFAPTFDASNRIASTALNCGPSPDNTGVNAANSGYDLAGNVLCSGTQNIDAQAYIYDAESRITRVEAESMNNTYALSALYSYDAHGSRIRKDLSPFGSSIFTEYALWGGETLAEKDQMGRWVDYVYANEQKIAKVNPIDAPLHISGINCSNCGGTASYVQLTNGAGYIIKSGDILHFSQYTVAPAVGGLILVFTDGSATNGNLAKDQYGQQINCDSMDNQLLNRNVSLSNYAGKTLASTLLVDDVCSPSGAFNLYFNDIAISSANGGVTSIYSPKVGALFAMIDSVAWPGSVTNMRAVAEGNTFDNIPGVHYYLSDQVGTTQMELASSGWPVWTGQFSPFGAELADGYTGMHYKFTGKERDTESGLDFFGARYYASAMGRWMSPDPLNLTEERLVNPSNTLNKYAYAANNPLKFVDPDGRDVTYFYDQGGLAGHAVLFAYNQQTGDGAIESFGPIVHSPAAAGESMFDLGPNVSPDKLRQTYAALTIQTSPELAQEVINYIRSTPDPTNWLATGPNCSTQCSKILKKFQLEWQRRIRRNMGNNPSGLWEDLREQYNPNAPKKPTGGLDYGAPRRDMFGAFWMQIQQNWKDDPVEGTPKKNTAPPCLKSRDTGNCV